MCHTTIRSNDNYCLNSDVSKWFWVLINSSLRAAFSLSAQQVYNHYRGVHMLVIEIGSDGILESWDEEEGCGQVLIDDDWYQVSDDGDITERVTVH